jgi:tetratricopeptide (TPR) repeat protein
MVGSYAPGAGDARAALDEGLRLERGGMPDRALHCYEEALAAVSNPALQAEALRHIADAHRARGRWADALAAAQRSAAGAAAAGLPELHAEALNAEGNVHLVRGDVAAARPIFTNALASAGDERIRGILLQNLGTCAAREGDGPAAQELFTASLGCFRSAGYQRGVLIALNNVAAATIEFGDVAAALPLLAEAGVLARTVEDLDLLLLTVICEAEALGKLGRHAEAEHRVGEALGFFSTAGNGLRRAECLLVLGDIHRAQEGPEHEETARRCYQVAARLGAELGAARVQARAASSLATLTSRGADR